MQILPPRRPGQLGAISLGPGAQSFDVKPGSKPSQSRPSAPIPPKPGSIATTPAKSVSEQIAATQAAAAQKATAAVRPSGQADVYGNPPTTYVQSYSPPPSTPAVTQPYRQPNESITVAQLAKQVPQTPAQVVQKVLAQDAGIAVPVAGPAPVIPANPPLPPAVRAPLPPMNRKTESAATSANNAQAKADAAKANAVTAATTLKKASANSLAASMAHKDAKDRAAAKKKRAKDAVAKLDTIRASTMQVLTSQTASEDAKAKAQSDLRDAQAEAQLAVTESKKADEQVEQTGAEKDAAAANAQQAANAAQQTTSEANAAAGAAADATQEYRQLVKMDAGIDSTPDLTPVRQFATMQAKSESSIGVMPIVLGLVAVGAIAYALRAKNKGLNGAPTLIEDLE